MCNMGQVPTKIVFILFLRKLILFIVALIIILDTFKNQISLFYPNIKNVLNNFYETLKDVKLFFIDLVG